MENKKNKNLGLALIAIFISILSIFISILKFNGSDQNNNYLLNGQQTHVAVEPIKHNAFEIFNDFDNYTFSKFADREKIVFNYSISENIYIDIVILQWFNATGFDIETYLYIGDTEYLVYVFNTTTNNIFKFFNEFNYEFRIYNVVNLEFAFDTDYVSFNDVGDSQQQNFDVSNIYYYELLTILDNDGLYYRDLYAQFYINDYYNVNDYNNTLFDNISLIATKVGAILVATLTPISTLLFANGKLTIVGASLAMALGVGAIYLIFRMVRGLIKQNERG